MSVHHVCTEELPACALPQLEARSDSGTLYVRHPAENHWDFHRAGGLLLIGSGFYCSKTKIYTNESKISIWGSSMSFFFLSCYLWFTEEGSVDSLPMP